MGKEQKILEELIGSKPEQLTGEAKRLFEAIMKIADERDELLEKNKEYEKQLDLDYVEENYIPKSLVKQKYLELVYEQNEGKNICENRFKIEILQELLKDGGE